MARERQLTPLAIAALAMLLERDMHPYEMFTTMMERHEDLIVKVRAGSLYHTVNRLSEDGAVIAVGTERDGNRPERTTYRISDIGKQRFHDTIADLLARPAQEYPIFPLAVAEAHTLGREMVRKLLRSRLTQIEKELEAMREGYGRAVQRTAEVHLLDIDYLIAMRSAEGQWLRSTIERLDDDTLYWKAKDNVR